jgi:lipopolysaccharide transport system ATP-binding protein
VFHVTHYKAGSQWIKQILMSCGLDRIVPPEMGNAQVLRAPPQPGWVYPTVYLGKQEFDALPPPIDSRWFVVLRDLRDTLVSQYFSIKVSHVLTTPAMAAARAHLQSLDAEEGLLWGVNQLVPTNAHIQTSWIHAGKPFIRYEDLLLRDTKILKRTLIDRCGLPVARAKLRTVVEQCRFEHLSGGRKPGEEDVTSHQRKGIIGDWRNHFTPRIKRAFKDRFGQLLIDAGYERNCDW